MQVRTRMCTSLDGYISNADGLPVQLSDPEFDPEAYGFVELQANSDAVLMGHTTLMPALEVADQWPWSDVDVFVLASERPAGTPDEVVIDSDPDRLLERVREANRGGDVHLIGGPTTIETYRQRGAIDEFGLVVLPIFAGEGMQLTPALKVDDRLELKSERALPTGRSSSSTGGPDRRTDVERRGSLTGDAPCRATPSTSAPPRFNRRSTGGRRHRAWSPRRQKSVPKSLIAKLTNVYFTWADGQIY